MPLIAGTWLLKATAVAKVESTFTLGPPKAPKATRKDGRDLIDPSWIPPPGPPNPTVELVIGSDKRTVVNAEAFNKTGAKYRSIVKLFIKYENQDPSDLSHAMGTGWLIRPNLLITAGHCAYDWGDSDRPAYGRAIEVIAHVGYSGKDSVGTSSVQTRSGAKIVTTEGWLRSANHQDDVSFIQLDQPFTDVAKWTFNVTPTKGFAVIGVVGYPGDKEKNREAGAEMYEEFKTVNWNLDESPGNMLKYDISTFGGQSGSPILLQDITKSLISLGTHVYGAYGYNLASAIATPPEKVKPKEVPTAGFYGNPYENYISIFDTPGLKAKESKAGVDFFDITPGRSETGGFQEEFWNSVKPLISVSSPNVPSHKQPAGPFGGQIGAAASVLAGHAIRVAGKSLTESSISSPPKQSTIERAILAESTLQAISSLPSSQIIQLGITQKTESIWSSLASAAKSIAPKLLPVLVEPVLNLLQDVTRKGTTEGAFNITEKVVDIPGTAPFSSSRNGFKDDFMKKLLAPTVKRTGEESIWDGLGSLVGSALSGGGALGIGLNVLSSLIPHGEASFQETPIDQNLSVLAKRATLAEATLQALQDNYNTTTDQAAKNITEGLFSKIIDAVQKIAPAVIKYAPQVADAVVPVVTNLLKSSPEVTILSKTKSANGLDSSTKTTNESLQEQADDHHGAITKKVPFVNGFASELSLADAAEAVTIGKRFHAPQLSRRAVVGGNQDPLVFTRPTSADPQATKAEPDSASGSTPQTEK